MNAIVKMSAFIVAIWFMIFSIIVFFGMVGAYGLVGILGGGIVVLSAFAVAIKIFQYIRSLH